MPPLIFLGVGGVVEEVLEFAEVHGLVARGGGGGDGPAGVADVLLALQDLKHSSAPTVECQS